MKKGQRPARHFRRVKTKNGRKRRLINPHIKKKTKRKYSGWRMNNESRSRVKKMFDEMHEKEELATYIASTGTTPRQAENKAIFDATFNANVEGLQTSNSLKELKKQALEIKRQRSSEDLLAQKQRLVDSIMKEYDDLDENELLTYGLGKLEDLDAAARKKRAERLGKEYKEQKSVDRTLYKFQDRVANALTAINSGLKTDDPVETMKFWNQNNAEERVANLEKAAEASGDKRLLSTVAALRKGFEKQKAIIEKQLPSTRVEATPAQIKALDKLADKASTGVGVAAYGRMFYGRTEEEARDKIRTYAVNYKRLDTKPVINITEELFALKNPLKGKGGQTFYGITPEEVEQQAKAAYERQKAGLQKEGRWNAAKEKELKFKLQQGIKKMEIASRAGFDKKIATKAKALQEQELKEDLRARGLTPAIQKEIKKVAKIDRSTNPDAFLQGVAKIELMQKNLQGFRKGLTKESVEQAMERDANYRAWQERMKVIEDARKKKQAKPIKPGRISYAPDAVDVSDDDLKKVGR